MTLKTNARLAGFLFLFYIVTAMTSAILFSRASRGDGTAATLASLAAHETTVRVTVLLELLTFVVAVVLAVALYGLTREVDHDLAMLGLCCRAFEGLIAAISTLRTLALLSLATATHANGAEAASALALGSALLKMGGWTGTIAAICFAVGSTIFSWLFLRGRSIPAALAWLGLCASLLLVIALPLRLAGFLPGSATPILWLPMLLFEVPLALWLMIRGVAGAGTLSTVEGR